MPKTITKPILNRLFRDFNVSHGHADVFPVRFRVDDRRRQDVAQDFCEIEIQIDQPDADRISISIKNPPLNDRVRGILNDLDGVWSCMTVKFVCDVENINAIAELADAIQGITRRGAEHYDNRNYKWIVPRTEPRLRKLVRDIRGNVSRNQSQHANDDRDEEDFDNPDHFLDQE